METRFSSFAPEAFDMGWVGLLPIHPNDKRPIGMRWQQRNTEPITRDEIETASRRHPDAGCGLAIGHGVCAIDLDHGDQQQACAVRAIADRLLGKTPLIRFGRAPRSVRLYRCQPGAVLTRKFAGIATDVFGTSGQVVLAGIHPTTGQPYEWPDQSPLDVSPRDLPALDMPKIGLFIDAVFDALKPADAAQRRRDGQRGASSSEAAAAVRDIGRAGDAALDLAFTRIMAAEEGGRHNTTRDLVFALVVTGWPDADIEKLEPVYLSKFAGEDRRRRGEDFARLITSARNLVGADAQTAAAEVNHRQWSRWK
jgi:hypothetical protein